MSFIGQARRRRWLRQLGVAAVCLAALASWRPPPAAAAPSAAAIADAKMLFKAGAHAYSGQDFAAALHAFEAARALVPDPALTFSIAQAHRRQYTASGAAAHLRAAVTEYQRYLAEVPKGGRRGDAAEALVDLEPKLASVAASDEPSQPASRQSTRLIVLSSVEGAQVSIDAAPAEVAPFVGEIEPGNHAIRVVAAGYRPYERTVPVSRGKVVPIDANLEPLPAQLLVRGETGATLWVDGRPRGQLPMSAPLAVPPGRRLLGVTRDGYRRFELELQLDRGQQKAMDVALETTAQRTVSIVTLSLAGASLVAAGVLGAVAGVMYQSSKDALDRYESEQVGEAAIREYNQGRLDHEPIAVAGIATGAVGLALGLTGALLFLLDDAAPASQVGASPLRPVQIGLAPAPHGNGVHLGAAARF